MCVYMFKLSFVISCFIYSSLDWLCSLFNICFSLWLHKKQGKVGIQNEHERERGMCRFYLLLLITAKKQWRHFFLLLLFFDVKKRRSNNHWLFDRIYSNAANKVFFSLFTWNVHFLFFFCQYFKWWRQTRSAEITYWPSCCS